MSLKPQDLLVALKRLAHAGVDWPSAKLAAELFMSASEVHGSVRRAVRSGLLQDNEPHTLNRKALLEFLIHGVKHAFPAERGGLTRGRPTSLAVSPLRERFAVSREPPPVWPDPEGTVRGEDVEPLHRSVPKAARHDAGLYQLLALVEAIRGGRARERGLAVQELRSRLG